MRIQTVSCNNLYFKANERAVYDKNSNLKYRTTTDFFRNDTDWYELGNYISKKYENCDKVNIVCHACSNGMEPYSFLMQMLSYYPLMVPKCTQIIAKDIDKLNIGMAKKGEYLISKETLRMIDYNTKELAFVYVDTTPVYNSKNYYQNYINDLPDNNSRGQEKEYNIGDKISGSSTIGNEDVYYHVAKAKAGLPTYMAVSGEPAEGIPSLKCTIKDEVKSMIDFQQGDILKDIDNLPDKNVVLFCKNFWPYLSVSEQRELAKKLSEKLDESSVLVIGGYDCSKINMTQLLGEYGFVKNPHINYLYEKRPASMLKND